MATRRASFRGNERMYGEMDKRATLGEYGTGDAKLDEMVNELKKTRPKEEDFVKFYPKEEIQADLDEIKRIKNTPHWKRERSFTASRAEAVMVHGIEERRWLGDGDETCRFTSEFDDIMRGVDISMTFPNPNDPDNPESDFSVAIDITSSEDYEVLDRKVKSSFMRFDYKRNSKGNPGGRLTRLKYLGDPKKSKMMNHYVLPISGDQANRLTEIFTNPSSDPERQKEDEIFETEVQIQTIQALRAQALLQIHKVLEKYCGRGRRVMIEYRRIPEQDKDDTEKMVKWAKANLDAVEKHLADQDGDDMTYSIKNNLLFVKYLDNLIAELVEKKEGAAEIVERGSLEDGPNRIIDLKIRDVSHF